MLESKLKVTEKSLNLNLHYVEILYLITILKQTQSCGNSAVIPFFTTLISYMAWGKKLRPT